MGVSKKRAGPVPRAASLAGCPSWLSCAQSSACAGGQPKTRDLLDALCPSARRLRHFFARIAPMRSPAPPCPGPSAPGLRSMVARNNENEEPIGEPMRCDQRALRRGDRPMLRSIRPKRAGPLPLAGAIAPSAVVRIGHGSRVERAPVVGPT